MPDFFRDVTLTINDEDGDPVDVVFTVTFSVDSWPTSDNYMEPGDAGHITIEAVHRDEEEVYAWAERTFYTWNVNSHRYQCLRSETTPMRTALFGAPRDLGIGRRVILPTLTRFTTDPMTVLDYLESECIANLMDYADDEPNYDYSY